jgi:hypothetical protein
MHPYSQSWWSKVEEALVVKPPPTPSSYIATYPDTPSTFYPPEVLTTVNTVSITPHPSFFFLLLLFLSLFFFISHSYHPFRLHTEELPYQEWPLSFLEAL